MTLFDTSSPDFNKFLSLLRGRNELDDLAEEQLRRELNDAVELEVSKKYVDGVKSSSLYQKLPQEIRQLIWSFVVVVPESIHVFPVKGNTRHGFRLSRCGDAYVNLANGWCECDSDRPFANPNLNPPAYLDTELLLVKGQPRP